MVEISKNFETFMKNCHDLDELPHCFDDTLVDKFIESVKFDDIILSSLEDMIQSVQFDANCVPLELLIRMIDSAIRHEVFSDWNSLQNFITNSEELLHQGRPAKLIHDLFVLYSNPLVFQCRKPDAWINVIRWSLTQIDDPTTSVFIRRQLANFLCELDEADARKLMVISGILQVFYERLDSPYQNAQIIDVATRILENYASNLVPEECIHIVKCVQNSNRIGENTIRLLVNIHRNNPAMNIGYAPENWKNEANRVDFVSFLLKIHDMGEERKIMIDYLLASPAFQIHHQIAIIDELNQKEILDLLRNVSNSAWNKRKCPIRDLAELVKKLKAKVGIYQLSEFMSSLGERVMESSSIFYALRESFGLGIFDHPDFLGFRQEIIEVVNLYLEKSEWEFIDSALEVAWIFPCFLPEKDRIHALIQENLASPYVLTTSLRILRDHLGGIPVELGKEIISRSPDPAPRLVAMKYISSNSEYLSIDETCDLIEICLEDVDGKLRNEALTMSTIIVTNYGMPERLSRILQEWIDDKYIGQRIREIIGKSEEKNQDESLHLIQEMLSALMVHRNDDDTMDCY